MFEELKLFWTITQHGIGVFHNEAKKEKKEKTPQNEITITPDDLMSVLVYGKEKGTCSLFQEKNREQVDVKEASLRRQILPQLVFE